MKDIILNLVLLDGSPSWIRCSMNGGTEIVCTIPRDMLEKSIHNEPKIGDCLKKSGIYFLLGEKEGKKSIYVGQASARTSTYSSKRLEEHNRNNDWFQEIIYLTTKDNSFGPTELDYLEKNFFELIKKSEVCTVQNKNVPNSVNITMEHEIVVKGHLENAKLIIEALGYKIFELETKTKDDKQSGLFKEKISFQKISNPDKENYTEIDEDFYLTHKDKNRKNLIHAEGKLIKNGNEKWYIVDKLNPDKLLKIWNSQLTNTNLGKSTLFSVDAKLPKNNETLFEFKGKLNAHATIRGKNFIVIKGSKSIKHYLIVLETVQKN